ncbi:MAG: GNAT family N-acetyltransferase [Parvularculaceae bacterium]
MALELHTDRLILRPLLPGDFEAHAAMLGDPRVAQFLALGGAAPSRESRWRSFASMLGHWSMRGYGFFSVFEKSSGQWAGRVGPWMPEGWPGLECGWGIVAAHWGKGYAGEAAIATIRWTFDEHPGLPRIISLIDPANANSQAVARKIGETKTGETFHHEIAGGLDIWAADREEWLKRFG